MTTAHTVCPRRQTCFPHSCTQWRALLLIQMYTRQYSCTLIFFNFISCFWLHFFPLIYLMCLSFPDWDKLQQKYSSCISLKCKCRQATLKEDNLIQCLNRLWWRWEFMLIHITGWLRCMMTPDLLKIWTTCGRKTTLIKLVLLGTGLHTSQFTFSPFFLLWLCTLKKIIKLFI